MAEALADAHDKLQHHSAVQHDAESSVQQLTARLRTLEQSRKRVKQLRLLADEGMLVGQQQQQLAALDPELLESEAAAVGAELEEARCSG